jgi:tRNA (cmo5U34)-methyltransferase
MSGEALNLSVPSSFSADRFFAGSVGKKYQLMTQATPPYNRLQLTVGQTVAEYIRHRANSRGSFSKIQVVDIGCGDGVTSEAILKSCHDISLTAIDHELTMAEQASSRLSAWVENDRAKVELSDASDWISKTEDSCLDIVASAFTFHGFDQSYRQHLLEDVHRTLRPGGMFVNGDIYVSDNDQERIRHLQDQIGRIIDAFLREGEHDLLCHWVAHYALDQLTDRVMKRNEALQQMKDIGFREVNFIWQSEMHAALVARKPIG